MQPKSPTDWVIFLHPWEITRSVGCASRVGLRDLVDRDYGRDSTREGRGGGGGVRENGEVRERGGGGGGCFKERTERWIEGRE